MTGLTVPRTGLDLRIRLVSAASDQHWVETVKDGRRVSICGPFTLEQYARVAARMLDQSMYTLVFKHGGGVMLPPPEVPLESTPAPDPPPPAPRRTWGLRFIMMGKRHEPVQTG
jgi:hypothetical protein